MRFFAAIFCVLILAFATPLADSQRPAGSTTEALYRAAAQSADAKFRHIEKNGASAHPDPKPTIITEREINAFFASGKADLPKGVNRLRVTGAAGQGTANALVDFDKVTQGRSSSSALMSLFSGTHDVEVGFHAQGTAGKGRVHVDSVSIDGIGVPHIALEYFANRYIKPKYPELGIDSTFALPNRINSASITDHSLTVIQK